LITLKTLSSDDWALWREMRLQALGESPASFGSTLAEWQGAGDTQPRWRARLVNVPFNVIAFLDGQPIGMASGTKPDAEKRVELISMWVAPIARGKCVGDALVDAVIAWAKGAPMVVRAYDYNLQALALYRRRGFVDAGSERSSDGKVEVVLVRSPASN
jgi:GNAT superfamily N-acetyltransferase